MPVKSNNFPATKRYFKKLKYEVVISDKRFFHKLKHEFVCQTNVYKTVWKNITQLTFTCLNSTIETLEKGVTIQTLEGRH